MNESIHGEATASELQDRVTELLEQHAAHLRRHPRQRHTSLSSRRRQLASLRRRRPSSRGGARAPPFGQSGVVIIPSARRTGELSKSNSQKQVTDPHPRHHSI